MKEINFYNRVAKRQEKEKVYGLFFVELLYGNGILSLLFSFFLRPLFSGIPLFSRLYGHLQKSRYSRRKVKPFIQAFAVDSSEFLEPPEAFQSFNDFFIRKLKPECRPIAEGKEIAILPADARYLVFPNIAEANGFWVKGKKFSLNELLKDEALAQRYSQGAMVIARLCPVDYHRFHFPCACVPGPAKRINGLLYSVNPIALKRNIAYLSQNKRIVTELETECFGKVLYIEVGATYVGSIHETYIPENDYNKGAEKGYFSFGGSCLLLFFEPNTIVFDQDLLEFSEKKMEVRGLLGQSLGKAFSV